MANEVHIIEMGAPAQNQGNAVSAMGRNITTQFFDIGVLSAQLNDKTKIIRIRSIGTGFFYKLGGSAADAVANADGNIWIAADQWEDIEIGVEDTHVDTAA